MPWTVQFHDAFESEFEGFSEQTQDDLLARLILLKAFGPDLSRPYVDTLKGSKHANMKELRFTSGPNVYRAAFAFDPVRRAIVLVVGNKASVNQKRFYKNLIKQADERFDQHLRDMKNG